MAIPPRTPEKRPPIHATSLATGVLADAQAERSVVQEYCPLPESLEWQLGQFVTVQGAAR